jgi:Putative DNA-binding domain
MLTDDDIRRLLSLKTENKNLDYKSACNWSTATNDEKCAIVKDILAMSNTQDGGQLVFGVADDTFELVGVDEAQFASFDPTRINDFLRRFTDPPLACGVYKFTIDGQRCAVIEVPEFPEVPIICKADANSAAEPRRTILKRGGLYVRTDRPCSELVSSAEEMRDIVARASRKKRDELLRVIRDLLAGNAPPNQVQAQPAYDAELADAGRFFAEALPADFDNQPHWNLVAHPGNYIENRMADQQRVADLIRQSTVALRGWDFPHTDRENASNFAQGRQSQTAFMHHVEGYRAYFSGLFCWKSAFWENERFAGQNVLSFIGIIFQITEFFQFLKRYYPAVPEATDITGAINIVNVRGLTLASMRPDVDLFGQYASRENLIEMSLNFNMAEIETDAEAIARRFAKRVFAVFNWDDISDDSIKFWQQKLLTRTY